MQEPTLTVAELTARVASVVTRAFPDELWVRGEIRDLNRSPSGHVYFSLVDSGDGTEVAASLPVALFAPDREAVNRLLVRSGALRMTDGVEVRIRGRVTYYAARGTVRLRMTWIDTDYTVGRLAADRERLLRTLRSERLLRRNAALPIPPVPLRVGLVTSRGSAAEADFLEVLAASGFGFSVTAVDSRVQGPEAPGSLSTGVESLAALRPDVIAMIRGGGAATDLAAFDDERVARSIATAPVPVFTGIGHEVDRTVADEVASRSFATPTACAHTLVESVVGYVRRLDTMATNISVTATGRLAEARTTLEARASTLMARGRAGVRIESRLTDRRRLLLAERSTRALQRARRMISEVEARVTAHDPDRLLARGWTITRDESGSALRSARNVAVGAELVTVFVDGTVRSRVTEGTAG